MCIDQIVVDYDLLVLEKIWAITFRDFVQDLRLVLCQEAQVDMEMLHYLLVLLLDSLSLRHVFLLHLFFVDCQTPRLFQLVLLLVLFVFFLSFALLLFIIPHFLSPFLVFFFLRLDHLLVLLLLSLLDIDHVLQVGDAVHGYDGVEDVKQ